MPNAWDVASAVTIARSGARAIATTSAGVAWSLGVPDDGYLGADRTAAVVRRIVEAVSIPVSADIEDGYGADPDVVSATTSAVIQAGAVGINLEDRSQTRSAQLYKPAEQAKRIRAARSTSDRLGVPVWINARTDVFLVGPIANKVADLRERASVYAAAGANSLFVPGLIDTSIIAELSRGPLPITVMAWAGVPSVRELAGAGAVRISLRSAMAQAAYQVAARASIELLEQGTYAAIADAASFDELNAAMPQRLSAPVP